MAGRRATRRRSRARLERRVDIARRGPLRGSRATGASRRRRRRRRRRPRARRVLAGPRREEATTDLARRADRPAEAVSPSPPPSVTRRDMYALETLSVGLPAGLANPTASCVHTSGRPPTRSTSERAKISASTTCAKHQRSRLHHHADHHATHVQHHHHQQDPGGDASPATPGDESTQLATTQPLMHSPKMPQPPITPEAAAEAARLVRVAEMLQTGGRAEEALAAIDTALTLAPGNLDAVTKRGLCFQALGALHDAYNAAIASSGANPEPRVGVPGARVAVSDVRDARGGGGRLQNGRFARTPGTRPRARASRDAHRFGHSGQGARRARASRGALQGSRRHGPAVLPRVLQPRRGDVRAGEGTTRRWSATRGR